MTARTPPPEVAALLASLDYPVDLVSAWIPDHAPTPLVMFANGHPSVAVVEHDGKWSLA